MIYRFPGSSSGLSFDIFTELVTRMLAFMKAACFLAREASLWAFDDISDSSSLCIHNVLLEDMTALLYLLEVFFSSMNLLAEFPE
jgi:hypothetical protein